MSKDDAKVVHVEKTEREGDGAASALVQLAVLGPFAGMTYDPGGKDYAVTLDDGRVGHGSSQEDAVKDAKNK